MHSPAAFRKGRTCQVPLRQTKVRYSSYPSAQESGATRTIRWMAGFIEIHERRRASSLKPHSVGTYLRDFHPSMQLLIQSSISSGFRSPSLPSMTQSQLASVIPIITPMQTNQKVELLTSNGVLIYSIVLDISFLTWG